MSKLDDSVFETEEVETNSNCDYIKPVGLESINNAIEKSHFPIKLKKQLKTLNNMLALYKKKVIPFPNRLLVAVYPGREKQLLELIENIYISNQVVRNQIYDISEQSLDYLNDISNSIITNKSYGLWDFFEIERSKALNSNVYISIVQEITPMLKENIADRPTMFSMILEQEYSVKELKNMCEKAVKKFSMTFVDDISDSDGFFNKKIDPERLYASAKNLLFSISQNLVCKGKNIEGTKVPMSSIKYCYDNTTKVMYDAINGVKKDQLVGGHIVDIDFNDIIGLENVKTRVNRIASYIKKVGKNDMCKHIAFLGNPGTGKTIMARALAKKLYNEGVVPTDNFVEADRESFIAEYIGQTAPKVKALFERAKGGVLFIDEAYALSNPKDDAKDYGFEAVSILIKLMEDNRKDTVVIFAGYKDKMKEFISSNPGLKSRIQYQIDFEDYTIDELLTIMDMQLSGTNFVLSDDARERIVSLLEEQKQQPEFGNGRFVRNMLEGIEMIQSNRAASDDYTLTIEDVEQFISELQTEEKRFKIGF